MVAKAFYLIRLSDLLIWINEHVQIMKAIPFV